MIKELLGGVAYGLCYVLTGVFALLIVLWMVLMFVGILSPFAAIVATLFTPISFIKVVLGIGLMALPGMVIGWWYEYESNNTLESGFVDFWVFGIYPVLVLASFIAMTGPMDNFGVTDALKICGVMMAVPLWGLCWQYSSNKLYNSLRPTWRFPVNY